MGGKNKLVDPEFPNDQPEQQPPEPQTAPEIKPEDPDQAPKKPDPIKSNFMRDRGMAPIQIANRPKD